MNFQHNQVSLPEGGETGRGLVTSRQEYYQPVIVRTYCSDQPDKNMKIAPILLKS